jgi:diguanylate cyclase (GGDEF)-like protein
MRQFRRIQVIGPIVALVTAAAVVAVAQGFGEGPVKWWEVAGEALLGAILGAGLARAVAAPIHQQLHHHIAELGTLRQAHDQLKELNDLGDQIDRAVDLAPTEDQCLELLGKCLAALLPERSNTVFLVAPSTKQLVWSVPAQADGLGVPVRLDGAGQCGATTRGDTHIVDSSGALDACDHLRYEEIEVSSVCTPLFAQGTVIAIAHSVGPAGDLPTPRHIALLERACRQIGRRIDRLRVERGTQRITTDELTGLASHATAHRTIRELVGSQSQFSLALCDVDSMGAYNAAHGSETGDEALRLIGDVLSATLRPTDLVARYGGDKFLAIFPNCSGAHAQMAMERVREALVLGFAGAMVNPVSMSVGIASNTTGDSIDDVIGRAERAVDRAQTFGGGRVELVETSPESLS